MTNSINQEGLKSIIKERNDLKNKVSELEDKLKLLSTGDKNALLLKIDDKINGLQEDVVSIIKTNNDLSKSMLKCDSGLLSDQFSQTHKLLFNNHADVSQLVIKKSNILSDDFKDLQKGIALKFDQSFDRSNDLYQNIKNKFDQSFDRFNDLYDRIDSKINQITGFSLELDEGTLPQFAEYQFIE